MSYFSFHKNRVFAYNLGDLKKVESFENEIDSKLFEDENFIRDNYKEMADSKILLFNIKGELYYFYKGDTIVFYKTKKTFIKYYIVIPDSKYSCFELTPLFTQIEIISDDIDPYKVDHLRYRDDIFFPINHIKIIL